MWWQPTSCCGGRSRPAVGRNSHSEPFVRESMKARRWAPILFGVAVFVVFVGISAAVFSVSWVREHLQVEAATPTNADAAFSDVRQRFASKPPLLELRDSVVARRHEPAADAPRTSLTTMHVLAWDPEDEELARFELPFWLIRLKESPIRFGTFATGLDELRIHMTAADIERYGPGIIIDITRDGKDVLVWVD